MQVSYMYENRACVGTRMTAGFAENLAESGNRLQRKACVLPAWHDAKCFCRCLLLGKIEVYVGDKLMYVRFVLLVCRRLGPFMCALMTSAFLICAIVDAHALQLHILNDDPERHSRRLLLRRYWVCVQIRLEPGHASFPLLCLLTNRLRNTSLAVPACCR